jgi:hypothetical protein
LRSETVRYGRRAWRRIYPKDTATWEAVATNHLEKQKHAKTKHMDLFRTGPEACLEPACRKKEQSEIPRMDMHVLLTPNTASLPALIMRKHCRSTLRQQRTGRDESDARAPIQRIHILSFADISRLEVATSPSIGKQEQEWGNTAVKCGDRMVRDGKSVIDVQMVVSATSVCFKCGETIERTCFQMVVSHRLELPRCRGIGGLGTLRSWRDR